MKAQPKSLVNLILNCGLFEIDRIALLFGFTFDPPSNMPSQIQLDDCIRK
jgi:hypothetical protein